MVSRLFYLLIQMKQTNYFLRFCAPLLLMAFIATSCGDDSDDVSGGTLIDLLQKNKWVLHDTDLNVYGEDELELRSDSHCLYFSSDTEGFEVTVAKILDTEGTDTYDRDFSHFTYRVDGNRVNLKYKVSGSSSLTYSDGKLSYGSLVYYPTPLNYSDKSVIEESKYVGNYDFDYYAEFQQNFPYYRSYYENGEYHFIIPMYFGVPANTMKRGITQFGIAMYCIGGKIENNLKTFNGNAYVYTQRVNGKSSVCFSGTINDNNEHDWHTTISVSSKSKSISLMYTHFFSTKDVSLISGDYFKEEAFSYDDDDNNGGGDNNGGDNNGSSAYKECPDNNHPHMIDLGLPSGTKWACCNVGANKPEDYGDYFAWGETKPKKEYNWDTYEYGSSDDNVINIGSDIAGTKYDAATANWGAPWRMPTLNQVKELDKCTSEWTTLNGVSGRKFKGTNGGSIFLPAAGYRWRGELEDDWGHYWSSTLRESSPYQAHDLYFSSVLSYCYLGSGRYNGLSVRPVR